MPVAWILLAAEQGNAAFTLTMPAWCARLPERLPDKVEDLRR